MNDSDIQKQWRALDETYTAMSDEELCSLAEKAYELTDVAQQALAGQMSARKLKVALAEQVPPDSGEVEEGERGDFDADELELAAVTRVWDANRANGVMQGLYAAGIPAYLGRDNVEKVSEFHSSFDSGPEVRVRRIDEQRALQALSRIAAEPDDEAEGELEDETYVVLCPVCKSDEVVFEELVAAASASDGGSSQKFHWRCDGCGHEWEDEGVEE